MIKADVRIIVCGRFHYHKFIHLLEQKAILNKFIYSYRLNYHFTISKKHLKNFPLKEYLMYGGRFLLKGKLFYIYLSILHNLWQQQAKRYKPDGNIGHFLIHGNCNEIIKKYKRKGMKIIGEVVNAHPHVQSEMLSKEYKKYGLVYESGEKQFENKIIYEYSLCDYLLVPSNFLKTSLVAHGIESTKIKVVPYGLNKSADIVKEKKQINTDFKIKLLCVSQITFRKGIVYLCEALELLNNQGYGCELTLIGGIDPFYEKVIQRYLTSDLIIHKSHVDNSQIENIMAAHDLLVMPSIEDGFGIVVSEALSVNLPVIVTKNCGASEVVIEGKNGFVVEPFSSIAIADAVRKSIGYQFHFNDSIFTWEDYVNELEEFYTSILN